MKPSANPNTYEGEPCKKCSNTFISYSTGLCSNCHKPKTKSTVDVNPSLTKKRQKAEYERELKLSDF
jgi:cytochrome c553